MDEIEHDLAVLDQGHDLLNNAYRLLSLGLRMVMVGVVSLALIVIGVILRQWGVAGVATVVWLLSTWRWWRYNSLLQDALRQHRELMRGLSLGIEELER